VAKRQIDWHLLGFQSGKLTDPGSPLAVERRIGIAALATCHRIGEAMPPSGYKKFTNGFLEGLSLAPLWPVYERITRLWQCDYEQMYELIGKLRERNVLSPQEIADQCDTMISKILESYEQVEKTLTLKQLELFG
jgi:hypothetical protein